jgi:iron complex transport system substrate-binding protein
MMSYTNDMSENCPSPRAGRGKGWGYYSWFSMLLLFTAWLFIGCTPNKVPAPHSKTTVSGYPLTLTEAQGESVTIPARPERIVSTAPAVTEILFALGAGERVVAVTDQCTYPPAAAKLPRVGGFWTPSVEHIIGARPDLVIGSRGNPPDFIAALRKSGVPVVTVNPQTLPEIFDCIRQVASMVGEEQAGRKLVNEMQARLDAVAAVLADVPETQRPTVFLVLQVNPPWTAGAGTFQDDAIRAAGGRNIASDQRSFAAYSSEKLMTRNPDFLLVSTMGEDRDAMKREVMNDPLLRRLPAVQAKRVVLLESDPLMRAGPRIVDAVESMARAFYPDRFPSTHRSDEVGGTFRG